MKLKIKTLAVALLALLASACSNEDVVPAGSDHLTDAPVSITVGSVETRAGYDKGDVIDEGSLGFWLDQSGTQYDAENLEVKYESGVWAPQGRLLWRNGSDDVEYAASYPYDADGVYEVSLPTDQQNSDMLPFDILYTEGRVKGGDGAVNIVFSHALAQLKVKLTFGETLGTNPQIMNITLSNAALDGTFTVRDDDGRCAWSNQGNSGEVRLGKNYFAEFECLLIPQTIEDYYITVEAEVDGINKLYQFESSGLVLEQGKTYTLPLQVGRDIATLNSPSAGTIAANPALLDQYLSEAGELVVIGTLDDEDMVAIGDWAIRNANDGTAGNDLLYLDLSGVTGITATPEGWFYKVLDGSYQGSDLLREVILPASVTHIADNTFLDCGALEKVTAEGAEYVEEQAVSNCSALTTFVGSKIKHIGLRGFLGCTSLKSLDLSNLETTDGLVFQNTRFDSFYAPKLKKVENSLFTYSVLSGITIDLPACTELGNTLFHQVEGEFTLRLTTKDNITLTNTTFDGAGVDIASTITLYLHENKINNLPEYLDRYTFKAIHFVDDAGNVVETLSKN